MKKMKENLLVQFSVVFCDNGYFGRGHWRDTDHQT